jgi:hypothetical protein
VPEESAREAPKARIAFARVKGLTLPSPSPSDEIRRALVPGTAITRYTRLWRLGQWREIDGDIAGRIGFQARGGVAEIWDPEALDFRQQQLPAGTTSPFVLDAETLRVAFQIRPGLIDGRRLQERSRRC